MLRRRRLGGAALIAALTIPLAAAAAPVAAAPPQGPPDRAAPARGPVRTVTLLTGDRVSVTADGATTITHGKGREGITLYREWIAGHLHVVPRDALVPLRDGRLDERLFDVTALLEYGYDRRADLPLIATSGPAARATARSALTAQGATVVRDLPAIGGLALRAPRDRVGDLWRSLTGGRGGGEALQGGVSTLWLDGMRKTALDASVPQIGAPAAWQAGLDGTGVTVAVLDTGIDRVHADLAGKVAAGRNFTDGAEDDLDRVGHGTHVAATVAGSGAASGGRYKGVAPGAKLLDGKVCTRDDCQDSSLVAGMQWAVEQGADVVNMSLSGPDRPGQDPVEQAVENLTRQHGVLFVIAAGNDGTARPVGSPASADSALAVGAVTKADELAWFSSRGPRVGDGAIKPDVTAPGAEITAARSKDGEFGTPGEAYTQMSGTSMATPHVAGAAAILAQKHPDWAAETLKAALMGTAKPNRKLDAFAQGAGRVDVARAIGQQVTANPPSASFGRHEWPHADDTPVTRAFTYRNPGHDAVTLSLTVAATNGSGKPAPAGMFSLSASTLTVPAGGEASVSLTTDTRVGGPDGRFTGALTAAAGDTRLTTPIAVEKEVESYDVTLRHVDATGKQTGDFRSALMRTDAPGHTRIMDPDGLVTVRLPKGRYTLFSFVNTVVDGVTTAEALLSQPRLEIDRTMTIEVDARAARPVSVTVPRADASPVYTETRAEMVAPHGGAGFSLISDEFTRHRTARLGPAGTVAGFSAKVAGGWARVRGPDGVLDSPYLYNLAWFVKGRMVTGFAKTVTARSLATVKAHYAHQGPVLGGKSVQGKLPGSGDSGHRFGVAARLPSVRAEYYNTDGGAHWDFTFEEWQLSPEGFLDTVSEVVGERTAYRAGRTYVERWNSAVFGPALSGPPADTLWVTRTGNTLRLAPPLYGDGAGRPGSSSIAAGSLTVYRNGKKIFSETAPEASLDVPAGTARYRVEVAATRAAPHRLSRAVRVVWTFRSGPVPETRTVRLPVSVVRFAPKLDAGNAAAAGRTVSFPVTVQGQPGSAARPCRKLTVEVSYDNGRTWHRARLTGTGNSRVAHLRHPGRAGYVSLRATATDAAGNTVAQTVLLAYRLRT